MGGTLMTKLKMVNQLYYGEGTLWD